MDKNVTVNKDMSTYLVRKTGGSHTIPTQPTEGALKRYFGGSLNQAWTILMNHEQRQDDRPRVASFLIDDILAPQALPSVVQCPSPHEAQSSARHISTGVTDHNTLLFNQPLNSTCLACYGNNDHLFYLFIVLNVLQSIHRPVGGLRNAQRTTRSKLSS